MNRKNKYYTPPFVAKMLAMYLMVGIAFLAQRGHFSNGTQTPIAARISSKITTAKQDILQLGHFSRSSARFGQKAKVQDQHRSLFASSASPNVK